MCNYFLFWLNVEKLLFGELGYIYFCFFSVGCENFDVYVVSDVFKRILFNLIDVNFSIVYLFYLVKLGCGYWCNVIWVSLCVGFFVFLKIKFIGIYFDEILVGLFIFDIFEVEEVL